MYLFLQLIEHALVSVFIFVCNLEDNSYTLADIKKLLIYFYIPDWFIFIIFDRFFSELNMVALFSVMQNWLYIQFLLYFIYFYIFIHVFCILFL